MDRLFTRLGEQARVVSICAIGLLLFAGLSYSANYGKSVTYDEVTHSVGGFVHLTLGDFRINPEDPVLFGYWGTLPHTDGDLQIPTNLPSWEAMVEDFTSSQWVFSIQTLFQTPGNDGDAFVQRGRIMFTILGVTLGGLITFWAWELGGSIAAVCACAFFCFDPNFLAHSSLFKNDVMISLGMTALVFILWRFTLRGTVGALFFLCLTTCAVMNIKFSGILCGPLVFAILVLRALWARPWRVMRWLLNSRLERFAAVGVVTACIAATCILGTWAAYQFRYASSPDPRMSLRVEKILQGTRAAKAWASLGNNATIAEAFTSATSQSDSAVVRVILWTMDHRLFPQAWLTGFLYTYGTTYVHRAFLLNQTRLTGWWYYFPCCVLFKTPTATLSGIFLIPSFRLLLGPRSRKGAGLVSLRSGEMAVYWFGICAVFFAAAYAGSAMVMNLNIGLRHILPIYPFIFISLALGLARLIERSRLIGIVMAALILLGLTIESFSTYPDYLSFFNFPSGGARGGLSKLGDSNLDWGQELKDLARWRGDHNDLPLYLAYFGTASPAFYQVEATNVPPQMGGWPLAERSEAPRPPCYFAVSATTLQAIYLTDPGVQQLYAALRNSKPLSVLGGSLYVYRLPLAP